MSSMSLRLFEVKVLEPETRKRLGEYTLDGHDDHPRRYRYVNCWYRGGDNYTPAGGDGIFTFEDGYCPRFMGKNQAWVVGEIDHSRYTEGDRFELADG
jgi:hypothetical protein